MAKDWVWKPFTKAGDMFMAERGLCVLTVIQSDEDNMWRGEAGINSPGEDETDALRITLEDAYETAELAQLAIVDRLRQFVEELHADFRGVD